MKKFFTVLFVGMGVLFLLQLIALGYLYVVDPLNLKPLLFGEKEIAQDQMTGSAGSERTESAGAEAEMETETSAEATLPVSNLSPAQERALQMVGIEPETLPQSFTEEQLTCFVGILGEARVNEIKAGATPTMSEYYQAKDCV